MNSLNIISSRVSPAGSPAPSRTNSLGNINIKVTEDGDGRSLDGNDEKSARNVEGIADEATEETPMLASTSDSDSCLHIAPSPSPSPSENTPLLSLENKDSMGARSSPSHLLPRGIATTLINSIRWVLSTLAAPGVYLIACLYTEDGEFSPLYQIRRLFTSDRKSPTKLAASKLEKEMGEKSSRGLSPSEMRIRGAGGSGSSSSGLSSESESDIGRHGRKHSHASSSRHSRSKSLKDDTEESTPTRRSIRIKLHDESGKRSHRKTLSSAGAARASRAHTKNPPAPTGTDGGSDTKDISAQLKSPTSPSGALTRYPKMPAPPRPLIPRRQPSYINLEAPDKAHQKTLILDLDETLIHSMSKGGRMSTGHMVEVRLQQAVTAGSQTLGPQHPILYYVHKRPHCDDFLRRVCKWYNLVVFTASVQEYADPVIDWLESERKFFSGRFYRQHCTFRHGAFIKDLSFVEPDLSKVMILDNSPLSYMFHQDNAIPIQGWINDPTDNDLLHLVPFLEGMQYVSDVRALLALRGGEDGQHMAYN